MAPLTGLKGYFPGRSYPRLARRGLNDTARFTGFREALALRFCLDERLGFLKFDFEHLTFFFQV
jgi:hypothetical protein